MCRSARRTGPQLCTRLVALTFLRSHAALGTGLQEQTLGLHNLHASSLPAELRQAPRQPTVPTLPSCLEGNVVLLDNDRLKASNADAASRLHLVPALHIDCDHDIDICDASAMAERAQVCCLLTKASAAVFDVYTTAHTVTWARAVMNNSGKSVLLLNNRVENAGRF